MKGKIIGAVRIGDKVYREGDEGAFAKAATADQISRLTDKGVIEGAIKGEAVPEPVATDETGEPVRKPSKQTKKRT
jgi:hypothetical protein